MGRVLSPTPPSVLLRGWLLPASLPVSQAAGPLSSGEGAAEPRAGYDLRLAAGRIEQIGHLEARPGERVVDCAGAYLCPGLIDAHVHLAIGKARDAEPHAERCGAGGGPPVVDGAASGLLAANARATLAQGVTAVRNLGNLLDPDAAGLLRAMRADPGRPLVVSAGRALTREGRYGGFLGRSVGAGDDLVRVVEEEMEAGADLVKVILSGSVDLRDGTVGEPHFLLDELTAAVRVAHRREVAVAAHANGSDAITIALRAGVDTLEHGILIAEDDLQLLAAEGTRWVPTLTPLEGLLGEADVDALPAVLEGHLRAVARGAELGARVVAGTDSGCRGVPHSSLGSELSLLRRAGLPPEAVARAATEEAAAALGLPSGYGRLEAGAATDLVWFSHDPFAADVLPPPRGWVRARVVCIT